MQPEETSVPMSSGFNTDVRVGEQLFHVQTEDRGPSHPMIDTAIYLQGRVVHRRSRSYDHATLSVELDDEALHKRVEEQHRALIEELRAGKLDAEIAAASAQTGHSGTIRIQLLNPKSWLSGGKVLLEIEVLRRSNHEPQPGIQVEAVIEGALRDGHHASTTDERGRVRIEFPVPPLGKGELALVIRARKDDEEDEIRFSMRSRQTGTPRNSEGIAP
jgi:hypothetical protein